MRKLGRWLDKRLNYIFTVPTIIFVLGMVLFPIIYTFALSFHSWRMSANIPWEFIGLDNYIDLFSKYNVIGGFVNSILYIVAPLFVGVFTSAMAAFGFARLRFPGKTA